MDLVKLYMAPVKGITDRIYHKAFESNFKGFDRFYTPFFCAQENSIPKKQYISEGLQNGLDTPFIPQILGNNPDTLMAMAKGFFKYNIEESCDKYEYPVVNINMGCPISKIVRKSRGSGLLDNSDSCLWFLDECVTLFLNIKKEYPNAQLSIKVRLGYNYKDSIFNLLPYINSLPFCEVILHPRLGSQAYSGTVDIDSYARFDKECLLPRVYNGDINRPSDFKKIYNLFPKSQAFMIGRGALSDPFLAARIKGIPIAANESDKLAIFRGFHNTLFSEYQKSIKSDRDLISRMKAHWLYLSAPFERKTEILRDIRRIKSLDKYKLITEKIYSGIFLLASI